MPGPITVGLPTCWGCRPTKASHRFVLRWPCKTFRRYRRRSPDLRLHTTQIRTLATVERVPTGSLALEQKRSVTHAVGRPACTGYYRPPLGRWSDWEKGVAPHRTWRVAPDA